MELWKRLRLTEIVYLSPIFLYFVLCTEYPIGAIFDENSSDIKYAFEKQIELLTNQPDAIPIKAEIQSLKSTDSFAVSNAICSLLRKGVYGIIGVSDASALSTIQSYSNNFKVPFIALSMIQNSTNHGGFQLFMRPVYVNGLLDVIIKYGWERILYIYDTDEGLRRLQQLFQAVNMREHFIDIDVKRVQDATNCYSMLKELHRKDEKTTIRVFLDIPTERAETVIVMLKNDTKVMNHKFHFLLGELRIEEMNLAPFKNGGINITGFQLLNYTNLLKKNAKNRAWRTWDWPDNSFSEHIPLEPALVIDAVNLFQRALKQLYKNRHIYNDYNNRQFNMKNVKCTDNNYVSPNNGTNIMLKLKGDEIEFNGLTGKVSFDKNGFRNKFKLHLLEITMNMGLAEVGYWKPDAGLTSQEPNRRRSGQEQKNKTRIVTTIIEPPYVMYKDNATATREPRCGRENFIGFCMDMADELEDILNNEFNENVKFNICTHDVYGEQLEDGTWNGMLGQLVRQDDPYMMYKDEATKALRPKCGKEHFIGFCADLAREVAAHVKFDYDICIVKDGLYGELLMNKTWNGMIGELTRDEVDLAIAPITITSQRERVVDFTKPYMSLGISIMIKKTAVKKASVFSFMDPLSYEIWMCILFAYIGVSVVLFLVSRFSPTEWHVDDGASITNDFTISNSLWYSLGAFMQQGCDISPRSVSGRIVGSVWWFFTLIIISSYTANLAAFLTVERMLTPIESAEDLAKQTEIQYGILASGSTASFFQQSKFPVHERMWAYMQSASPSVFVKSNKEGIEKVRKGNYAYLMESTTNKYTNMRKPCDTMQVGPNLDSKGYGIATPIGSDLRDPLTLAVLKLREAGRLEEMQKDWWEKRSECPMKENNQDGGQAELTLENVAGIFYILAGGLTLSVIIAFFEFIYKSKLDSKRSKKPFGSVLRCKARLSFRGSLDRDNPNPSSPLRKSMSTYTYTGPSHVAGADGFPDNLHTQV